jgi:ParB family chromosome partitioning protein
MSKSTRSRGKTAVVAPSVEPVAPERLPVAFALRDLAVAPENLRFDEPADDGIGELADTIFAATLLQPLTVRPGRGEEAAAMVLDGRRRLLALQGLHAAGRIGDDYPVSCFVETDPARQAAAVVLTNTAVPVHPADVIVAIGKMLKARLTVAAISAALGYGEVEIRRLAALAALHPKALEALRAGRCTLRQAKLLARLPDPATQAEIAEAALNGFGFQEWRVNERLDAGAVTVRDRRFGFVGAARYAEAGGRVEADLFGERADVLLDPGRLQAAWTARAQVLAQVLSAGHDWQVVVAVDEAEIDDGVLEPFGYAYGLGLGAEELSAWRAAAAAAETAQATLSDRDLAAPETEADVVAFLAARIAADLAAEPSREATLISLYADCATGLDVRVWGPPAVEEEQDEAEVDEDPARDRGETAGFPMRATRPVVAAATPLAVAPRVELDGVNHGLHEVRTDTATRALIRALADDPAAALVAVVARLFVVVVLDRDVGKGAGALSIRADAYGRPRTAPIEALDGDVRRRLAERRAAWESSELSPIAWVASLPHGEKMALLAELVALSLDLREERTTSLRRTARAEAVEIAALCQADITLHWTPDAAFLGAHPKSKLLGMLDDMGAGEARAGAAKKDELVSLVAERAAERGWAPAYLSWSAQPPTEDMAEAPDPADEAEAGVKAEGGAVVDGEPDAVPRAAEPASAAPDEPGPSLAA